VNYGAAGSAVVREFVVQNAVYGIEQFRLDGLRLDAVHAIRDGSDTHLLKNIAARIRQLPLSRPVHVLLENEENRPHVWNAATIAAIQAARMARS
jgi:maltooligosyltrehalose trehalohydrolase